MLPTPAPPRFYPRVGVKGSFAMLFASTTSLKLGGHVSSETLKLSLATVVLLMMAAAPLAAQSTQPSPPQSQQQKGEVEQLRSEVQQLRDEIERLRALVEKKGVEKQPDEQRIGASAQPQPSTQHARGGG